MNAFTESNTVEQMILDAVAQHDGKPDPARWTYAPASQIPRQPGDVTVEPWLREALIHLNPEITAQPDRADEVIYNLRACIHSVQAITASTCRCAWWIPLTQQTTILL